MMRPCTVPGTPDFPAFPERPRELLEVQRVSLAAPDQLAPALDPEVGRVGAEVAEERAGGFLVER